MPALASLQRLLDVRKIEEEHRRSELEMANTELRRLEEIQCSVQERRKCARALLTSSAGTADLLDRIAGLVEISTTDRMERMLMVRVERARIDAQRRRQDFLGKRLARRQVETLVDRIAAETSAKANRKTQSALDDWHRSRRNPKKSKSDTTAPRV